MRAGRCLCGHLFACELTAAVHTFELACRPGMSGLLYMKHSGKNETVDFTLDVSDPSCSHIVVGLLWPYSISYTP